MLSHESSTAVYAYMENSFANDFQTTYHWQLHCPLLYMLVETVRSSFTGRGDPSE